MAKQIIIAQTPEVTAQDLEKIIQLISFNENGELVVTIDGVTKTFIPKEETVQASYNSETETISLNAE